MPFDILVEDGPLLAVNKPSGLLTQGVPQGQPSLESEVKDYLRKKYAKPGNVYLGVPHRLDRPVSGIVVFGRNSKCAARLAEQFRERSVQKIYLAVTEKIPDPLQGRLTDWLLKDAAAAHVSVVSAQTADSREAVLEYQVIAQSNGQALVQITLLTGRMHQIRVQLASRGWPIIGDQQYGACLTINQRTDDDRLQSPIALHAWRLSLFHPIRYDRLELEAPVPGYWRSLPVMAECSFASL